MQREPTDREIADWYESPITRWVFESMQDDFSAALPARPLVDLNDMGKTAMHAAFYEGQRAAFAWVVHYQAERKGEA